MLIGLSLFPIGSNPQGWRLAGMRADGSVDGVYLKEIARRAEMSGMHFLLLGDRLAGIPASQDARPFEVQRPEALTTASYLAAITEGITIITTVNSTYSDPFNVARQVAQLDHLSAGRVALNLVTGKNPEASANFGTQSHPNGEERYARATEYVEVLRSLWESWRPGALVADRETGRLVDPSQIVAINYRGQYFSVGGPLNIASSPQGVVPIGHAGNSHSSEIFGSQYCDFRYIATFGERDGAAYYHRIKSLVASSGGDATRYPLIAGLTVYVAPTRRDAQERYKQLIELGVQGETAELRRELGVGEAELRLDERVQALSRRSGPEPASSRLVRLYAEATGESDPTVGHLSVFLRREKGKEAIVGGPVDVANHIERLAGAPTADAFAISPPYMPQGLHDFADLVIPVLRDRGLLDSPPRGTFREVFSLKGSR